MWSFLVPSFPLLALSSQYCPLGCHRPRVDDRKAMDAIFYRLRTGCQWKALDATGICSSSSAHRRFQEWTQAGVFQTLWSCVIYLVEDSPIAQSELVQSRPDGRSIHHFEFEVICLWRTPTQELQEKGLIGLLPLLPLTREGRRREVVEEIVTVLIPSEEEPKRNLLIGTYVLASLAFEQDEDNLDWLYRRFVMIDDIIREAPAYKMLTKEAHEDGIQEGLELGRQKELQRLRDMLLNIVKARFPKLVRLAKKQGIVIEEPDTLDNLVVKVSIAQTSEEARQHLLTVYEGEDDL